MDHHAKIRHTIDALFGSGVSRHLPKDLEFILSRKNGRIRHVYHGKSLLCTLRVDGGLAITLHLAKILMKSRRFADNCIEIDADSRPFVEEGRSVFCSHVVRCGRNVRIGSDVAVLFDGVVIAVGKAVLSHSMITGMRRGVAVKVRDSLKNQKQESIMV